MSDQKLILAVIAGASHALKFKENHPKSTDKEALKHVTENADLIVRDIED